MVEAPAKPVRRRRRKKMGSVDDVRALLSGMLPSLLENATQSYEGFSRQDVPQDAKGFSAHHAACKAALSHLELLTKLCRWVDKEEDTACEVLSEDEEIAGLLAGARAALQEMEC